MSMRKLIGVVVSSVAIAAVCGCANTPKSGETAKACCDKCPAGCKCGGTGSCCKS